MDLTPELAQSQKSIEVYARKCGLDFFDVIFEVVDFEQMNELACYGGFPNRYPHWHFAMEFERLKKSYAYGLHKIYEMVINNDPCYAYLLHGNMLTDQRLVMAHVYAHCDFFKNNAYFSKTNRKMMDQIANNASKIHRIIARQGAEKVERFLDICLSLQNLIDVHSPFIKRRQELQKKTWSEEPGEQQYKLKSKSYMDRYINPEEFIEEQKKAAQREREAKKSFPVQPEQDVLLFLLENAPLESWEQDILNIVRDEAYYFAPQGQTKIMNEGWATFWHSKMMTGFILTDAEVIDYADHHSGTVATAPGRLNPYKIGLELFRDIEDRWDKGKFGREYEECEDLTIKKNWNKETGLGREKIFEVRKLYNDLTFIDTFFTEEFCFQQNLFAYEYNNLENRYEISNRNYLKIKEKLLDDLTNLGTPNIKVTDANYLNRNELLLKHTHEGVDLKIDEARDTLENLQRIWKRPVHIETRLDENQMILYYDGEEHFEKEL